MGRALGIIIRSNNLKRNNMIEIIVIASFFAIIAALLYLIYLGNKNNPMSISATEDIMKITGSNPVLTTKNRNNESNT